MNLKIGKNVEQGFWDIVDSIPKEILKIQGLDNIDLFDLADKYLEAERVADISIDVNANVDGREPVNFQSEIEKPQLKLRSYYILWLKIIELYGQEKADTALIAMLDGSLYFHDITKIDMPYCFAFDTSFLMNLGRPYGWLPSKAPKRSSSFIGQLVEVTMDLSQAHAGAIGIANVLVNLAYYTRNERAEMLRLVKKFSNANDAIIAIAMYAGSLGYSGNAFCVNTDTAEKIENKITDFYMHNKTHDAYENEKLLEKAVNIVYDKYVENLLQQFVHVMHNTFRVGGDSPFTNISIFDRWILKSMFGDEIYPDMTSAGDNIEEIMHIQEVFIEYYSSGAPTTGKNYRFPVATINLKTFTEEDFKNSLCKKEDIGKIADNKFFSYMCQKNHKKGPFNIHIGEKIASCCFGGNQLVLTRSTIDGVKLASFEETYNNRKGSSNFKIFHNGCWVHGKVIRVPARQMYKVTTEHNKNFYITDNHINPTYNGEKLTKDLTTNDYLLFNTEKLKQIKEHDKHLTYEQGFLIGMYLGDGSGAFNDSDSRTSLSLNKWKYTNSINILKQAVATITKKEDVRINLFTPVHECYPVAIQDRDVKKFIQQWVKGNSASEKELVMDCLLQSVEFRKGILEGHMITDGDKETQTRIYTTSEKLINQVEALLTSLGMHCRVDLNSDAGREIVIRGKEYTSNYPVYCIRIYDEIFRGREYKELYKRKNNSIYFKIKSIEKVNEDKEWVYCFEMRNQEEPYFTLPNGAITHNCRLTSDLAELKNQIKIDSFGNGGISIGSHRVVALNLHRIALVSKYTKTSCTESLEKYLDLAEIALVSHKEILKERIATGFLKFFNIGWEKIEMFFSTVGYTGIWEMYETLFDVDATKQLKAYTEFCETTIDSMEDFIKKAGQRNEGYVFNLEEIPGEGASPKCAAMDNILYKDAVGYNPVHLLSNQMVPLYVNVPIFDRLKIEGDLMNKVSGGAILHLNMNETMTDKNYEDFLRMIIEDYGIVHFTINRGTTTCVNGHTSIGVHEKCPVCGGEIYTYTIKVVGFNTDTISWTKERRDWEFGNRQFYCSTDILE